MLDPAHLPTLAAIRERWAAEAAALRTLIAGLDLLALDEALAYQTTDGRARSAPRWQIFVHLANHGTQHRSEAAACSPPSATPLATST